MSYGIGEDALLKTIRRGTIWNTKNTETSDWNILNNSGSRYAILRPGEEFEVEVVSINGETSRNHWSTIVEVWRKHTEPDDVRRLLDDVNVTIKKIKEYPFLGKGETGDIHRANVISGGAIEERWSSTNNGPKWLVQEFIVMWSEEERTTHAE